MLVQTCILKTRMLHGVLLVVLLSVFSELRGGVSALVTTYLGTYITYLHAQRSECSGFEPVWLMFALYWIGLGWYSWGV